MSELAELISEAIDATSNHVDVIDRVIAENAINTCVYCGEVSFKGFTVENGRWTSIAQQAMTNHVLSCSKRPEAKLTELLIDARKYAQMALVSAGAGDLKTVKSTLADLLEVLTPKANAPEAGSGDNNLS